LRDFGTGDSRQLTGDPEVVLESPEINAFQGAVRLWIFRPRRAVLRPSALPLRFDVGGDDAPGGVTVHRHWGLDRVDGGGRVSGQRGLLSVLAVVGGVIFGVGLVVSGMTDPSKVIGFLDFTRDWNPALMFVMGGAVVTYALAVRYAKGRGQPWLAPTFHWPSYRHIDAKLVVGAAVFGVGWGLTGYCPGPGIVAAGGTTSGVVFVIAMCVGIAIEYVLFPRPSE